MHDFQENPFQYGNEQPVLNELYHRLRMDLPEVSPPVRFRTDYGDENRWRVRRAASMEDKGNACRVRTEVSFIHEREKLRLPKEPGSKKLCHRVLDLAIFSIGKRLVMHSKKPGPGDFWDTKNHISVLCEVKHSRNMASRLYAMKYGGKDVNSLSLYPGSVEKRCFLFFDWWPIDANNTERYARHKKTLEENTSIFLQKPVELIYIPRVGNMLRKTLVRS